MFNCLFWSVFTVYFNYCFLFAWQTVDSMGKEVAVLRDKPCFNIGLQIIQIVVNFIHLPASD